MRQNSCITFIFYFALFLQKVEAQNNFRISNWTVKDGLSQGSVHKMLRDSMGFLWIATDNGLNRFDGTNFRQYKHGQGPLSNDFHGSEALGIVEDSLHNIWVGTEEGLNRYVTKSDTFQHFSTQRPDPNMTSYCMPLVAYQDKVICWEITGNIVSYNIRTLIRNILYKGIPWPAESYYKLDNLSYDPETTTIWAPYNNKIICLQLQNKAFELIDLPDKTSTCNAIISDNSSLLVATSAGLLILDKSKKIFEKVRWARLFSGAKVLSLSKTENGIIWVGVENMGLYQFETSSGNLYRHSVNKSGINSLSSNNIFNLYTDKENITWAGAGEKAIDQIFPYEQAIEFYNNKTPHTLSHFAVKCFAEDKEGRIWIGTQGGGINLYNPAKKTFSLFNNPGIGSDSIQSLKFNTDKSLLWIATNSGIIKMESSGKKLVHIILTDEYGKKITQAIIIHHIALLNDSTFLLATSAGVFILSQNSNIATITTGIKDRVFFIGNFHDKFTFSLWDYDPVMYSYNEGKWKKEIFPFDDITVGCIFFDEPRNVFWIGTDRGLLMTDTLFRRIRFFTMADGLPDNFIWGIVIDSFRNIWVTTNKGIARYSTDKNKIISYNPADGIHGFEYNPYAYIEASDKTIYLGGKEGFDHINPSILDLEYDSPEVFFSGLRINNKTYPLASAINFLSEINLSRTENNLIISAGIIDFHTPGKTTLNYKLSPVETIWQEAKAPFDIRYSGLPPGSYILQVTTSNSSSKSDSKIKTLKITIQPPFWQQWWFIASTGVISLLIIYLLGQQRINQIRKREIDKTANIKRMAELELQSLRAQLNPHFMFNSLNAIQELILLEENEKSQSYLSRFSKLLRLLLENANKPFIPIQNEIEFLQLYIALENLRIPDLQFTFITDPQINLRQTQIPNMILQPFIENAIWHGLSEKKGIRKLQLRITQDTEFTQYEIADNGVGRKKAEETKSLYRKEHKSKGMELIARRLELLSDEFGSEIQTIVKDISLNGEINGTLVTIKVPLSISNEFKTPSI